jgi:hypothetical protein
LGTGHAGKKVALMTRCPDCGGTQVLPDGEACGKCNEWGEVPTGKSKTEKQLCKTCWGSGKVDEKYVTIWTLLRFVPGGLALCVLAGLGTWLLWGVVGSLLPVPSGVAAAIFVSLICAVWGGVSYHFVGQMQKFGQYSMTTWFVTRAVPTTLVAVGTGGGAILALWLLSQHLLATAIFAIVVFFVWGGLMAYFITRLPE